MIYLNFIRFFIIILAIESGALYAVEGDDNQDNSDEFSYVKHQKIRRDEIQKNNYIEFSLYKTLLIPGTAFALDRIFFHPLDNILSHQQVTYRKIGPTFIDIVKKDGFSSLYAGFWKPFLTFGPARISMLSCYYNLKRYLMDSGVTFNSSILISSISAGLIDATLTCPAEVSRIRATFKKKNPIFFKDYFQGYNALLMRSFVGAPIILAGSDWLLEHNFLPTPINSPFYAGVCTGFFSQFLTCPLDVWKNYVMVEEKSSSSSYYIKKIINERSYYRGLQTKMLRMSLGSGLVIGIIHNLNNFFSSRHNNNESNLSGK